MQKSDNPRDRSPTIGWLAAKYDIVLLQEDFEYHGIIAAQMGNHSGFRGGGIDFDPRRVTAKIILFPFAGYTPLGMTSEKGYQALKKRH